MATKTKTKKVKETRQLVKSIDLDALLLVSRIYSKSEDYFKDRGLTQTGSVREGRGIRDMDFYHFHGNTQITIRQNRNSLTKATLRIYCPEDIDPEARYVEFRDLVMEKK